MKKDLNGAADSSGVLGARSFGGFKMLGQVLATSACILCATLNTTASNSRKSSETENYRRVAFVGTAVAKSTGGNVEYLSGTRWLPAKPGQVFNCEELCRTKENGEAIFQMRTSGSLVRVGANTIIRFCPLSQQMPVASLTGYEALGSSATVRAVRGSAEFQDKGSRWQSLRVNSTIPAGATVRTLGKTTVDLFFAESGLVMRINPESEVTLNAIPLIASGEIQTNRKSSGMLAQVGQ